MAGNRVTIRRGCGQLRYAAARAFTLVELIVVIGIFSAVALIAVPSIARVFTSGADAQAYNLMAAQLASARARAMQKARYTGVHVQMVDPIARPPLEGTCYMAVLYFDSSAGDFKVDKGLLPERIPGTMAFGELSDSYVEGGNYKNLGDVGFTTFTVVFSPSGSLVKQVEGKPVKIDTAEEIFTGGATGTTRVWNPALATDELGATALTIFDHAQFIRADKSGAADLADRAKYLNVTGQFLTINVYTGQLERRK